MTGFVGPSLLYGFLQLGVVVTFAVTAVRAWRHSRARFVELMSAFVFGLLLEQGDIFLFGTYRYNENWVLVGDVPVAIALTWAMVIAGAMNITDALGIRDAGSAQEATTGGERSQGETVRWLVRGLPAPMADAVWAILLDLALDAVAIRLGLWTWTIRMDEGWFGVPWGNFFAWLFVAFWFSFFTRWVLARERGREGAGRERYGEGKKRYGEPFRNELRSSQWLVPFLAFGGLIGVLVPFVALENTAALPFVPDEGGVYRNQVWILFALTLGLFACVTGWALAQERAGREPADHWLLLLRLVIHGLFLIALVAFGIYLEVPLLLIVALGLLLLEILMTHSALVQLGVTARRFLTHGVAGARNEEQY